MQSHGSAYQNFVSSSERVQKPSFGELGKITVKHFGENICKTCLHPVQRPGSCKCANVFFFGFFFWLFGFLFCSTREMDGTLNQRKACARSAPQCDHLHTYQQSLFRDIFRQCSSKLLSITLLEIPALSLLSANAYQKHISCNNLWLPSKLDFRSILPLFRIIILFSH